MPTPAHLEHECPLRTHLVHRLIIQYTGNADYQFGDITKKAISSFTGKDECEPLRVPVLQHILPALPAALSPVPRLEASGSDHLAHPGYRPIRRHHQDNWPSPFRQQEGSQKEVIPLAVKKHRQVRRDVRPAARHVR